MYTNLLCNQLENLNHNVLQGIFHREDMYYSPRFGGMADKLQIRIAGPGSVKVTPGITSSLRLVTKDWKKTSSIWKMNPAYIP